MWAHHNVMPVDLAAPFAQVINQFFARFELAARGLIAIEIANKANSERDVVQIIAVNVATIDLSPPTIADLDFAVAGRGAIADDEVVGQSILHAPNMAMIIIENARATLSSAAVVHDDELPSPPHHRRAINFGADRS